MEEFGAVTFLRPRAFTLPTGRYANASFEEYVKSIEEYPDESFDLVLVDGRHRSFCIPHAIPKVRPGGYLMLDNSDRRGYRDAISLMSDFKRD